MHRFAPLALLSLALASPAAAQAPANPSNGANGLYHPIGAQSVDYAHARPENPTGREAYPMMVIDERTLSGSLLIEQPFPALPWAQAIACLKEQNVTIPDSLTAAPPEWVVPVAKSIMVGDMTLDSLNYADDSTYMGSHFQGPTVAYSLVRSDAVLVTEGYQRYVSVMRHEALHILLWRTLKAYGHPVEYFGPCDQYYDLKHP